LEDVLFSGMIRFLVWQLAVKAGKDRRFGKDRPFGEDRPFTVRVPGTPD
jgi:hypothetical protein